MSASRPFLHAEVPTSLYAGASSHGDLLDLERLEARGAYPFAPCGRAFLDTHLLQVRVSAPARRPQRVAAGVAEVWLLCARITNFRHETSPVLGYRSNLGTPAYATRRPCPDVGRRLYQIVDDLL